MLLSCRPSRRARSVLVVCVRRPRPSFRARPVCMAVHRAAAPAHQYARVFCVRRYSTSWARGARVDELPPSSAPDTSPRRRDPFMASLSITPARGSKNAAVAAGGPHPTARTHRRGAAAWSSRTKGGAWHAASTTETAHPSPRRRAHQPRLGQSIPRRARPTLTGDTFFAGRRYWFS